MTTRIEFTKMHGLGNDFILVEATLPFEYDLPVLARRLCHRQTGIGADGLLLVSQTSEPGVTAMRVFNADGSEASMCGNGVRCFARYVYDRGISRRQRIGIRTGAGTLGVAVELQGDEVVGLRIDMGVPQFEAEAIPMRTGSAEPSDHTLELAGATWRLHALRMGVPHAVSFVERLRATPLSLAGPAIEGHEHYPEGINVNFVEVLAVDRLRVRTWERGAGLTLACGTGACAAAVIAARRGFTGPRVNVELELGSLFVEQGVDGHVYMTGPATYVCSGIAVAH